MPETGNIAAVLAAIATGNEPDKMHVASALVEGATMLIDFFADVKRIAVAAEQINMNLPE